MSKKNWKPTFDKLLMKNWRQSNAITNGITVDFLLMGWLAGVVCVGDKEL